jgi:hypothetical protein
MYCLCVNVYCTTTTGCNPIAVDEYIIYQNRRLSHSQRGGVPKKETVIGKERNTQICKNKWAGFATGSWGVWCWLRLPRLTVKRPERTAGRVRVATVGLLAHVTSQCGGCPYIRSYSNTK